MKIGIYGGTFDPIHAGHAMLANFVAQCNVVDEVWIMVNRQNPLKSDPVVASDQDRLQMAILVAKNCRKVKVSNFEMSLPAPSFTINTLTALEEKFSHHQFTLIIGSDSLVNFKQWKDHKEILDHFGVIVYPRPGYPLPPEQPEGMTFLNGAPEFGISSSLIREYVASGWNINFFVPVVVSQYIKKNKLYQ